MSNYLVTGVAGFVGMHCALKLLNRGDEVTGYDNLSDYYEISLKENRLVELKKFPNFKFIKADIADRNVLNNLFSLNNFDGVIHLAAQAGVRYSVENASVYGDTNLVGFLNILECCRHYKIKHLVFASSSSVYGGNKKMPYVESDAVDHPISLYAATKRSNELMAHSYSHLYGMPITGLRFFTAYGPWGRPDQSLFLFVKAILSGEEIKVFNDGKMCRDFTYIDDISEGVVRVLDKPASSDPDFDPLKPIPQSSHAPFRIFNIGNSTPVQLIDFISAIEIALGKKAIKKLMPLQDGDVIDTFADTNALKNYIGFKPCTSIDVGVQNFVNWYKAYYK